MTRAVLYGRVSTAAQAEDDRVSLTTQRDEFRRYCDRRGYEPSEREYVDVMSGVREDRPQYQQMLKDGRAGHFERVVSLDVTRFGRDAEAALFDLISLKRTTKGKVEVEFIRGRHRSLADLVDDLEQGQEERQRLSTRLRGAMITVRRGRDGKPPKILGVAPYGYRKADGQLVIVEEEAAVIREAFRRYRDGEGSPSITRDFTRRGIMAQKGTPWGQANLLRSLQNRTYIGESDWRGQEQGEDGEWREVRGMIECPAIIDREMFDAVQEARLRRAAAYSPRGVSSGYLLSSILYCGDCNGRLTGWTAPKPGRVYRCANKWPHSCRPTWYVKADQLEESVISFVVRDLGQKQLVEAGASDLAEEVAGRLASAKKRLDAEQRRMDRAIDRLGDDDPEWERQRARLLAAVRGARADVEHLEVEYQRHLDRVAQAAAITERVLLFAEQVDSLPVPAAKARLQTIVRRVDVYDRGQRAEVTPL